MSEAEFRMMRGELIYDLQNENARLRAENETLRREKGEALDALSLMYEAWNQLMPNLRNGVVQDYALVLTKAPVAARKLLDARAAGEGRDDG